MKPTFKTTAVAILVALGVTACNGSKGGDNPAAPSNQDQPVNPQPEAKPQPQPEAKPQPQPGAKPESKPQPQPEAKPQPQPESKPQPQPEAKPQPEVKPVDVLQGKEWRYLNLGGDTTASQYSEDARVVRGTDIPKVGILNFNKLSKDKVGSFDVAAKGEVTNSLNPVETDKRVYFVNQPYSSYGVVYTPNDTNYETKLVPLSSTSHVIGGTAFTMTQNKELFENNSEVVNGAIYKGKATALLHLVKTEVENPNKTLLEKLEESANFKPEDHYSTRLKPEDGTVTLNVTKNIDNSLAVSGEINSNSVGKLNLHPIIINKAGEFGSVSAGDVSSSNYTTSYARYNGNFSDNGKDVVGQITTRLGNDKALSYLNREPSNERPTYMENGVSFDIYQYEAVFGGTKQ